jgi:hypothetical protein
MHLDNFSFGSLQIDGSTYEHDVVIDRGEICKRKKKASKQFRMSLGTRHLCDARPSVGRSSCWCCRPSKRSRC